MLQLQLRQAGTTLQIQLEPPLDKGTTRWTVKRPPQPQYAQQLPYSAFFLRHSVLVKVPSACIRLDRLL